jgi:rare lipoprotein A (peptidoglycan hydrolase)
MSNRLLRLTLCALLVVVLLLILLPFAKAQIAGEGKNFSEAPELDKLIVENVRLRGRALRNWRLYLAAKEHLRAAQREARRLRARLHHDVGTEPSGSLNVSQASWYGPGFYGNRTACGLTLTTSSNWVAHKTMACGTRLLICAARCARSFVGDRGPTSPAASSTWRPG